MGAPKLLDKRIISAQVATEKKQLIDTGLKLARSVDVLRETKVEEEGNLERFRIETIARVQADIDLKIHERDSLVNTINLLKENKTSLLISADPRWERIFITEELQEKKEQKLNQKEQGLFEGTKSLDEREKKISLEEDRIANKRKQTNELLLEAKGKDSTAKEVLAQARNDAQTILTKAEIVKVELTRREEAVDFSELAVEKEWLNLHAKERELAIRELQLSDGRKTLERAFNRINKK